MTRAAPLVCQVAVISSLVLLVEASASDPNHNNFPSSSQYTVSQHVDLTSDLSSLDDKSPETALNDEEQPSVVASSILYDGGCTVSAEAMMISGGGGDDLSCCFETSDFFEDESDDDDDDDDDGHSSMLSNASLQRSKAYAGGGPSNSNHYNSKSDKQDGTRPTTTTTNSATFLLTSSKAFSVRGGAAATTTKLGSEFAKHLLVAALVTLVYEACAGHMLEFIKVVMQTSPSGTSYLDVIKSITAEKGIAGVWDGFVPWGVVQAIGKGGVFGLAHAIALSILKPLADDGKIPRQLAMTLAGGIAGGFQGFVLSPTLLLKTRVMTNPVFREKMSMLKTTRLSLSIGFDVVREEGPLALMKGSGVFATKRVFDWATRYYFSDVFTSIMKNRKGAALTQGEKIGASLLAGTASTLSTLPLDVLVSKTQDSKKAGVKVSAWKLFMDDLHENGVVGLWNAYMRGFEARLLHVCFTTVAMQIGNPIVYSLLFPEKKAQPAATATA